MYFENIIPEYKLTIHIWTKKSLQAHPIGTNGFEYLIQISRKN